ncbi:MAG TPA: PP2C family protein-serine/threonine phosphatase [Bryobacteraceae bacterium]|jgi:sigma-B regulation protein RsbU (phosphoserine phosphatase)|nr:PP2C family protein-serine/threonine phosphatase [Bryobacteraceae bacterium]
MSLDSIPAQAVQTALRSELPFFGIASVLMLAGISSLLLALLRSRDRLLFWLGLFSVLYASRLFLDNGLVHLAIGAPDRPFRFWSFCLTCVIPIPYARFAWELLGPGWKKSIAVWFWIEVAFAVVALPVILVTAQTSWMDSVNTILIIGGTLLILLHVVLQRDTSTSAARGLAWPLIICGGLVLFRNFRPLAPINAEPLGFLTLLAGLSFTASRHAITRERKLVEVEQELTTARRIQNSIIPEASPEFASVRIATRYQPMSSVAGDFFDFLKTGENSLTILVADVSGHGVPAALVASMLKVCFAAQRKQSHDPAAILTGLNSMLRGSLGGQYVTAACAAIDLNNRTVNYAGAGHPPALLLRSHRGDVLQLAENGLFIGPFPSATYSNISAPFESGDKLLLYTDGILEATGADGQEFGLERLAQFLLDNQHLGPAELIQQLFQKIAAPAQQDDLTAVLAQFVGQTILP